MVRNSSAILIGSSILFIGAVVFYIVGLSISNVHMYEWAKEVGGAGLVGIVISSIEKIMK